MIILDMDSQMGRYGTRDFYISCSIYENMRKAKRNLEVLGLLHCRVAEKTEKRVDQILNFNLFIAFTVK